MAFERKLNFQTLGRKKITEVLIIISIFIFPSSGYTYKKKQFSRLTDIIIPIRDFRLT